MLKLKDSNNTAFQYNDNKNSSTIQELIKNHQYTYVDSKDRHYGEERLGYKFEDTLEDIEKSISNGSLTQSEGCLLKALAYNCVTDKLTMLQERENEFKQKKADDIKHKAKEDQKSNNSNLFLGICALVVIAANLYTFIGRFSRNNESQDRGI